MVFFALGFIAVFVVATILDPYKDGQVWLSETHRQLGLPPCTFKHVTGLPCASCGMSTSFALAVRGDLVRSVQANFVGTLLALFGLVFVPWSLISAWRGRFLWIRAIDSWALTVVLGFMILLFVRWGVVLLLIWLT